MNKTNASAILLGLGAIVPFSMAAGIANLAIAVIVAAAVYIVAGILFSWITKNGNWHWGFLIAAPIMAIVLFSMAFTGIFTRFFDRDLPLMVTAIIAPCVGVFIGGRITARP